MLLIDQNWKCPNKSEQKRSLRYFLQKWFHDFFSFYYRIGGRAYESTIIFTDCLPNSLQSVVGHDLFKKFLH